jgi:hypothetical protein
MIGIGKKPPPGNELEQRLGFRRPRFLFMRRSPSEDPEIVDDYRAVCVLWERLSNARAADGKAGKALKTHLDIARACLEQVEYSPTLEEKWSCINRANAILVLACVNRDEQAAVMLRLKNLFPLLRDFKDRLPQPFKVFDPTDDEVKSFDREWAYQVLETAAQGWHLVNEQNGFSTRFWRKARKGVTALLIAAIVGTELAIATNDAQLPESWRSLVAMLALPSTWLGITNLTYVWAALFGTLGGALSSLLGSRSVFVSATTYRVSRGQAQMRVLLGGVGAFIVVLAIDSGLVFADNFEAVVADFLGLAVVAIAAGFSERLFITALERIAGTLEKSQAATAAEKAAAGGVSGAAAATKDPDVMLAEADMDDRARLIDLSDQGEQDGGAGVDARLRDEDADARLQEEDADDLAEQMDEDDKAAQV